MSKGSSPRDPNKTGRVTPELPKNHVILFTGNYGSGKTEVAVNYASWLAREGKRVQIADLDLVNPYFRVREAREPLEKLGIEVVAPAGDYHSADLPILLPQVKGLIEHPKGYTILDVGGDNVGATVLSALTTSPRPAKESSLVVSVPPPALALIETKPSRRNVARPIAPSVAGGTQPCPRSYPL